MGATRNAGRAMLRRRRPRQDPLLNGRYIRVQGGDVVRFDAAIAHASSAIEDADIRAAVAELFRTPTWHGNHLPATYFVRTPDVVTAAWEALGRLDPRWRCILEPLVEDLDPKAHLESRPGRNTCCGAPDLTPDQLSAVLDAVTEQVARYGDAAVPPALAAAASVLRQAHAA